MAINWRQYTPGAMLDRATARPGQTLVSAGAGLLGSLLGGPLLGQAASQGVRRMFDRGNDRRFDESARRLMESGIANNNAAIWGSQSGSGSYTPAVPNSPSYGTQSPLLSSLGIPDYNRPQQPQSDQGLPGITSSLEGTGYGPNAQTLPAVSVTPRGVNMIGGTGRAPGSTSGVFHGVGGSGTGPLQYQSGVSAYFNPYIEY